ncbi:CWF19-like protein 1 [Planococcus citri]|uniref:CWF19-like protein 1 n=1 Tax=Planococcus citri TaxID=170843 RepID=UPI0031FA2714
MAEQLKILVCGDVEGKFKKLFTRVDNITKKSGPFDYLFCVGNFFGSSDEEFSPYKSGELKSPISTYVLGPNDATFLKHYPEVNGCELAHNITYLGKRGVFNTNSGLTIAYVSGVENSKLSKECQITEDDIDRVRTACIKSQQATYRGTDILLTSQWPAGITDLGKNSISNPPKGSVLLAKLAYQIKPRYHFFALEKRHYERPPYKNQIPGFGDHITRPIALANVANENKEKWLYAMNVKPLKYMRDYELYQLTTDTTECPFSFEDDVKHQQYFYDMNYRDRGDKNRKRKNRNEEFELRKQKVMNVSQDDCWFCLASPKFEKHLVVSIGEESYLTLAKGGLVADHVMILPIAHYRVYSEMPKSLRDEIEQFKKSLTLYCKSRGKVPVFFDRNFKTPHYQMQVIPIPSKLTAAARDLFMDLAEEKGLSLTEVPSTAKLEDISTSDSSYFYVEIGEYRLMHSIKKFFPLQFAREVLANERLLNLQDRIEWRNCPTSREEEEDILKTFRNDFSSYDFTA